MLYLALKTPGTMTSIKDLTKELNLPYHFVAKILQGLTRKGLLTSLRGPSGGFELGMPAEDITLFQIVEAIDGTRFMHSCLLCFPECSNKNRCAVHEQWAEIRTTTYNMLIEKHCRHGKRYTEAPISTSKES